MKIRVRHGTTRTVLIIKNFAFKFPRIKFKNCGKQWYINFLSGLMANYNEVIFSKMKENEYGVKYMPVIFHLPLGVLNVMRAGEVLTEHEFNEYVKTLKNNLNIPKTETTLFIVNDAHHTNFIKYKNNIFCIDYV